jgi:asparagine synthase (glutamine-hydrolysing)
MCGISGAVASPPGPWGRALVEQITDYQRPRGPDMQAVLSIETGSHVVTLGHNRLSIIDPVPGSNQPFFTPDRTVSLVFNGEIYNYKELRAELFALGRTFLTASDTEVLLQAYCEWGVAAFDRFLGMFAFAILDLDRRQLLLVRDRFGVKPLFYRFDGNTLAFASTPGVIARDAGCGPNLEYAARGIQLKYYEDESAISPYRGIDALEPSHYLTVDLSDRQISVRKSRYYDFAARVAARTDAIAGGKEADLVRELREILDDACRLRLRSDVPVGLSLSGGLDSSTIAILAGARQDHLLAFSYGQPDDATSEGPLAAEVGRRAGLDMRWIWPKDIDLSDLFMRTLQAQGAPFPHTSQMAQFAVFERARADGVKVLLGGQGGDEALMGYRKFFLFQVQQALRDRRVSDVPTLFANAALVFPAIAKRAGTFWSERHRYSSKPGGMDTQLNLPALTVSASPAMTAGQTIRDRQIEDITRFSLPTLLRYEDRNSMANSIESRLPFMDHRLLEFGVALPTAVKLRHGFGKWALRAAMKDQLPESIRMSRDKRGFDTQQAAWISGGLGNTVRALLHEERSVARDFLASGATIDATFSDDALINNPQALKEAITLVWIADPLRWQPSVKPSASIARAG